MFKRLSNSAVVWSWGFNGLRLASGLILLPLALHKLSASDLGMYYVLLSLAGLAPVMDFGLRPTIGRFVNYAMGGAREFQPHGISKAENLGAPNYDLLWQLLLTMRTLYRYLTFAALIVVGLWGTYIVELRIHETSSPTITRLAWGITLAATLLDVYSNWWGVYLLGMNKVLAASRISVAVITVRLIIAAALFCVGAGLLSLPIATLFSDWLQRHLARVQCLALLKGHPPPEKFEIKKNFQILWPNSWRLGAQFLSGYLTINANTAICVYSFGLVANAKYGLSIQLMNIAVGMAAVWVNVKWPLIGQHRARHDYASIRQILWQRLWLQNLTFLFLAGAVVLCGPALLRWTGSDKEMLPMLWLGVLMLYAFLSLQFTTWTTLIVTGNRISYLWPTVATNIFSLILSLALVHFTSLGLGALVLGPLLAGIVFNFWYWPVFAAHEIEATLFNFLFRLK